MGGVQLSRRASRWVRSAAAGVCGLLALLFGSATALANVALTQVSSDPYTNASSYHATEVEPDTFAFGSTIVSTFQVGRFFDGGASNIGWATSTNAGTSWSHGFLPGTTVFGTPAGRYPRASDPAVAYDPKHKVWLINDLGLSASGGGVGGAAVLVSRSPGAGLTWANPVTVATASSSQNLDKNWIVCDSTATSPHYGSCYVEWDDAAGGNQLHMAFSRNGGLTWTQARVPTAGVIAGQPLVQPNGNVVMPIDNAPSSAIESFLSTDGGVSYTGPFAISSVVSHAVAGGLRSPALPTAEIDSAGRVYAAWADCRFIAGCTANDIVFSSSSNGKTWSAVKRIPIDSSTSGQDNFLPGLAVDRHTSGSTAALALTYYFYPKANCTTATCQLDVGFVRSLNGGTSWTAQTQLAGPSKLNQLADTTQGFMVGDYLSTSFVTSGASDLARTVFAVGKPVVGDTCTLGDITSCNESMNAPTGGLSTTAAAAALPAVAGPILSTRSDHPVATLPRTQF